MEAAEKIARRHAAASLPLFAVLALFIALPIQARAAETLETVTKSAEEWVKLRVETARVDAAWKEERSLVESMVAALDAQAETEEERRELVRARTAREREELDGLRAKIDAETADLQTLESRLTDLTSRLAAMRPALPPRLSEALEMSYLSLENTGLPAGERMQLAMNVLNRCAQFDRAITVGEDVVAPEPGVPARSLEVIYWGLSHGYALDRTTRTAWLGAPSGGVWRWEPKPDAFKSVAQLIAIATDRADPEHINVPASVSRSVQESAQH